MKSSKRTHFSSCCRSLKRQSNSFFCVCVDGAKWKRAAVQLDKSRAQTLCWSSKNSPLHANLIFNGISNLNNKEINSPLEKCKMNCRHRLFSICCFYLAELGVPSYLVALFQHIYCGHFNDFLKYIHHHSLVIVVFCRYLKPSFL